VTSQSPEQFTINQGTTWKLEVTWKNPNGTAIDLTGYSAKLQFRHSPKSSAVLYEMSTANGKIVLDEVNGKLTMTAPKADTAAFAFTEAILDLLVTAPSDGEANRLFSAIVFVSPSVTR